MKKFWILCLVLAGCIAPEVKEELVWTVRQMQGAPAGEMGIELGVSACYAGTYNGWLLMAGGCNFPEIPASAGGKKRFYQGIYVADGSADSLLVWKKVGELPVEAAYGVSVSTPQGVICAGGTNQNGALSSVFRISLDKDATTAVVDTLPSLPCTIDNMGGAVLEHYLFIVGGNVNGAPSNALYCLDLDNPDAEWTRLPDFPGAPRTQSVCVAQRKGKDYRLYLWGGFAGAGEGRPASLSLDGYSYHPWERTWTQVAVPMGKDSVEISLGGGVGIACGDSLVLCAGGVNKDIFLAALKREEKMKRALAEGDNRAVDSLKSVAKAYMTMLPEFYRFNDKILIYNTVEDCWKEVVCSSQTARAGAALVGNGNVFFNINGELKPGIRTPEIVKIESGAKSYLAGQLVGRF
ncbi:cyclically-permuted mutarotase family protein [uncultured Bacteroides sp.]|uniref:cyclically-permuted mutarotase family protein n=1 Tax=uncultured Bacteroides sp. TaxID=162156 RepID=UPI00272B6F4E|nr:cyclically-permuted mutarotase family protein [uncultured Bacteroides sp.]